MKDRADRSGRCGRVRVGMTVLKLFGALRSGLRPHKRCGGYAAYQRGRHALMQSALALAALGAVPAVGDQVSLTPVKDNTLFESVDGSLSSGAGDFLFVGLSGAQVPPGLQHRAVLAFDLSSIPQCSIVESASLTLTLIQASPFGGQDNVKLHHVLADWGEGTSNAFGGIGAPSTQDDATWIHTFFPDQFWGSAGGDFSPVISAGQTVGNTTGEYTWGSTPLMVNDVQSWLINPDTNFGWIVIGNEMAQNTAKRSEAILHPL